ncbi:hypothetical protein AJ85_06990 [Alkalihalobacillus alcalophilus ATCC 27647 = CGMCC 1.3604]|uniref:Uncharacterized protein n=1 Tax=Alkalihalobacillus alcalophilus ATCC 27647 = CGMCC 1.3604 TaxID=1218173 RepID=A0A4V3X8P6_ALKAL|nr:hypothetical protein [Alkalihalobacillus alcalophilus]MED1563872.1 hypothetical protein [Alkalihalobacillus alcalophilus]THG91092.1 hypothetical protein AJ85_06990 [Alkalihalobacillus alcalophilus ATCC 27647 = CGMCC 1.3604]
MPKAAEKEPQRESKDVNEAKSNRKEHNGLVFRQLFLCKLNYK